LKVVGFPRPDAISRQLVTGPPWPFPGVLLYRLTPWYLWSRCEGDGQARRSRRLEPTCLGQALQKALGALLVGLPE